MNTIEHNEQFDLDIDIDLFENIENDESGIDSNSSIFDGFLDIVDDDINTESEEFEEFDFEPIDFEDGDDILLDLGSYDDVDYTNILYKLQQHLSSAYTDIQKIESIKISEIQLPILRENFPFLEDDIFSIYVDIWKNAIKQPLPSEKELLQIIYDVFENINYSLRLAKTEFEKLFISDYTLIHNNILIAKKKEESRNVVCTNKEQKRINETFEALTNTIVFSKDCDNLISKTNDINLSGKISDFFPDLKLDFLTGESITTVADVQRALNTFANSENVIDLLKNGLNMDCSNSCAGEVIRLALLLESKELSDFEYADDEITIDTAFNVIQQTYSKYQNGSCSAYLLLCCFAIILCGTTVNGTEELLQFTQHYLMFVETVRSNNTKFLYPAIIKEIELKDGVTYAKCNKGGECIIDDFYIIAGVASRTITIPLVNECCCKEKNCSGALYASPAFFSSLIDWISKGTIEGNVKDNLKYRVTLKPKELIALGIPVIADMDIVQKGSLVNKSLDWFLQFQNYINRFNFEDDNSVIETINYIYRGPIDLEGVGDTNNAYVNIFGISEQYTNSIVKLLINSMVILDGVWEINDDTLNLYFFMEGAISEQVLTLPLEQCIAQEKVNDILVDNKSPDISDYIHLSTGLFENVEHIQNLANSICNITGLPYELQIEAARERILTNYSHLFRFEEIKDFLYTIVAKSYLSWLDDNPTTDWVNFSMLKMILNTIYTEDNPLASISKCSELTDTIIADIKNILNNSSVFEDILRSISLLDLDLLSIDYSSQQVIPSKEDMEFYKVCLAIPSLSNILITLENKIAIASAINIYRKRLNTIFNLNSTLLKIFTSEVSVDSLSTNIALAQKKFKTYRNLDLFTTVSKLLAVNKNNSSTSLYNVLKFFILRLEFFEIVSTLIEIKDDELVTLILNDLHSYGFSFEKDFFTISSNKEIFNTKVKKMITRNIFMKHYTAFLQYVYTGILFDISENSNANIVVAYDILSVFYDELFIEFDPNFNSICKDNFIENFFYFIGNLYVTYGYVEDEAIMDTSEIKDRAISFRSNPESFPMINSPYFLSLDLHDLLYIGDGE